MSKPKKPGAKSAGKILLSKPKKPGAKSAGKILSVEQAFMLGTLPLRRPNGRLVKSTKPNGDIELKYVLV